MASSDVLRKRKTNEFLLVGKSLVFPRAKDGCRERFGLLSVVNVSTDEKETVVVRCESLLDTWGEMRVGRRYRSGGRLDEVGWVAGVAAVGSATEWNPCSTGMADNPLLCISGTVIETNSLSGTCKILCEEESEAAPITVIFAPLLALDVQVDVRPGDVVTIERYHLVDGPEEKTAFLDAGSLLQVTSGARRDGTEDGTVAASSWTRGFYKLVSLLGFSCVRHFNWFFDLAKVFEAKFGDLGKVPDSDLCCRVLVNACGLLGAHIGPAVFDAEAVALRDFDGSDKVESLPDDVVAGLASILTKSPEQEFPKLGQLAAEVGGNGEDAGDWSSGSCEPVTTPGKVVGYFTGCTETGKAILKDNSDGSSVFLLFQVPLGEEGPDLTWMHRPCFVRGVVKSYEVINGKRFPYVCVNVKNVQFLADHMATPADVSRHNHQVWVVGRSRMLLWNQRPVYMLDVVVEKDVSPGVDVVIRHETRTFLMDGRFLAMLHPFLRPGTAAVWSFPATGQWRRLSMPVRIPPFVSRGTLVSTRDGLEVLPAVGSAPSPLAVRPKPETVARLGALKLTSVPSVCGIVTDVYRSGYGTGKPQIRINLGHGQSKICVYCDEPGRLDLIPLGIVKNREMCVSTVQYKTSQAGNPYLQASTKTDFQLGLLFTEEEILLRTAPLLALDRILQESPVPRAVKFVPRQLRRFGPAVFSARCSRCRSLVPNHYLDGPNCADCAGAEWFLDVKAVFMVSDGTSDAFLLESEGEHVLVLLGFREKGKKLLRDLVRLLRVFTLAPRARLAPAHEGDDDPRYQKAREVLQTLLRSTHMTRSAVVTAKVMLYSNPGTTKLPNGYLPFRGRLFCKNIALSSGVEPVGDNWSVPHEK